MLLLRFNNSHDLMLLASFIIISYRIIKCNANYGRQNVQYAIHVFHFKYNDVVFVTGARLCPVTLS